MSSVQNDLSALDDSGKTVYIEYICIFMGFFMSVYGKRMLSLLLVLLLLLPAGFAALADEDNTAAEETGEEAPTSWDVRVFFDGLLTCRGYGSENGVYLSVEDICRVFDRLPETLWEPESGYFGVAAPGLSLTADANKDYLCVNNRYLYNTDRFTVIDDRVWFPIDVVCKIFNLVATVSEDARRVDIDGANASILSGSDTYYSDTFGSDNVFWLARIIRSEAGLQPLAGRIGVGNVVLNRVADERYPDDVYGVVFDTNFNVQFEPILNGTVYIEPDELDYIAAYLALEGYNTVGESLFFIDPYGADDTWLRNYKTFVVRIGGHDFYS